MPSAVAIGARAKARTKKWLEARGYQVADMEVVRWVGFPKRFPVKRDQMGADLLAMSKDTIIFVQVKGGKTAVGNFLPARRAFAAYTFPPWSDQWIVAWTPRAREPRIVSIGARTL